MEDTISAIATALGVGAVGIIRVSGPESLRLVNRIFRAKEPLSSSRPRYLQYGHIHDGKGVDVDEVMAVYMPGLPTREKTWWKSSAMADGKR